MTFEKLAIGDQFRFFADSALLTKSGPRTYDAPQWDQRGNPLTTDNPEVIPVDTSAGAPAS